MDKVERLTYLITKQIKERPPIEYFDREEYRLLLRNIYDWCGAELRRNKGMDQDERSRNIGKQGWVKLRRFSLEQFAEP